MKTAFEILQSKLTIADTSEFRLIHIPEILDAMEEYKAQLPQQEISDEEINKEAKNHHNYYEWSAGAKWYREQLKKLK
jgi:hypothetical protein